MQAWHTRNKRKKYGKCPVSHVRSNLSNRTIISIVCRYHACKCQFLNLDI